MTETALQQQTGVDWSMAHGDCVPLMASMPTASVDFSVYSPPFAQLYVYSASDRDMGNVRSYAEFFAQFRFAIAELARVLKPGRNMSVHAFDIPKMKARDGEIGLIDFPGDLVKACEAAGFIWHSRVTIWKDPVTQMQRTKSLGLLHKQVLKDSCMSRMGIPDYVLTFRKPGVNPSPVTHTRDEFPVEQWQKWASPVWDDIDPSDTLQYRSAREDADERHIAPLQLEVIRRCIRLWSKPSDVVLSPFAGIGSEGYVALQEARKFVGCELKASYWKQACANLASIEPGAKGTQAALFAGAAS